MNIDGVHEFAVDNGTVGWIGPRLLPGGPIIRLYDHWPRTEIDWTEMSVPFTPYGANMRLAVQSLNYDVEMAHETFLGALDELDRGFGGLYLVQSATRLPGSLHPRNFRKPETYLRVLRENGACLTYDLPHQNETALITIFGNENLDYLTGRGLIEPNEHRRIANPG